MSDPIGMHQGTNIEKTSLFTQAITDTYNILQLSTLRAVQFHNTLHGFEADQDASWSMPNTRMTFSLPEGEWSIALAISLPAGVKPQIEVEAHESRVNWISHHPMWEVVVIDVIICSTSLTINFFAQTVKFDNDNREIGVRFFDVVALNHNDLKSTPGYSVYDTLLENLTTDFVPATASGRSTDGLGLQTPEIPSTYVEGAVIIGEPAMIGVQIGSTLNLLTETTPYPQQLESVRKASLASLEGAVPLVMQVDRAMSLCGEWNTNVWHWYFEFLPYAVAAENANYDGQYIVSSNAPLYRDSLNLFGIPSERLISRENCMLIRVNQLLLVNRAQGQDISKYSFLINLIQQKLHERFGAPKSYRRLYIARRGARIVLNEDEVFDELAQLGFERVYMEDYTFEDQIKMATQTECLVGPHGAGMSAALFMPKSSKIIELFSPTYVNPCLLGASEVLGHHYQMIVSRIFQDGKYDHELNVMVDIQMLRAALRNWSVSASYGGK